MKTLRLTGALADIAGLELQLDVDTPLEALRAVLIQFPQVFQIIQHGEWAVLVDGEPRSLDNCRLFGGRVYEFVPATVGASGKSGGLMLTILGAALIVSAFYITGPIGIFSASFISGALMTVGSAVMSYGTSTLFAEDVPKSQEDRSRQSWTASPTNTSAAGSVVPVVYGRMRVGSLVISSELISEQIPYAYRSTS